MGMVVIHYDVKAKKLKITKTRFLRCTGNNIISIKLSIKQDLLLILVFVPQSSLNS